MLLRGIAAIWAATVSRAPPSPTVVHVNVILGTSGQTIRQQSRTSSVIGLIFLTATLAAPGVAWGAEQTTHVQDHPLSIKDQIVGAWWLESIYEEDSRGEDIDQFGVDPTGLEGGERPAARTWSVHVG